MNRSVITRRHPRQIRAHRTYMSMLNAATEIILEGGLNTLKTQAVAKRAKVPLGTLYEYFADRQAIIDAISIEHVNMLNNEFRELKQESFKSIAALMQAVFDKIIDYETVNNRQLALLFDTAFTVNQSIEIQTRESTMHTIIELLKHHKLIRRINKRTKNTLELWFVLAGNLALAAFSKNRRGDKTIIRDARKILQWHAENMIEPAIVGKA